MAIDIIPKRITAKPPILLNVLFYLSLTLLIISILSYFALFLFQKNSQKTLNDLEKKIALKGTPEEKALEAKILLYQDKINNFSDLINSHQLNSNFFNFLESLTHPQIFFSKADLKIREGHVFISGIAENFEVLGQQFLIFKEESFVKNVSLLKASVGKDGKIEFDLDLVFDPAQFKY